MKLWVTNIPVGAFVSDWVEIPDATPEDKMNEAIKEALCGENSTFAVDARKLQREGVQLDDGMIERGAITVRAKAPHDWWQFDFDTGKS